MPSRKFGRAGAHRGSRAPASGCVLRWSCPEVTRKPPRGSRPHGVGVEGGGSAAPVCGSGLWVRKPRLAVPRDPGTACKVCDLEPRAEEAAGRGAGPHCRSRRWRSRSLRGRPDGVGVGGITRFPNGVRVTDSEGPSAPRAGRAETEPPGRPQVPRAWAPSGSSRCGVARTGSRGDDRGWGDAGPGRARGRGPWLPGPRIVRSQRCGAEVRGGGRPSDGDQARRDSAWPECSPWRSRPAAFRGAGLCGRGAWCGARCACGPRARWRPVPGAPGRA